MKQPEQFDLLIFGASGHAKVACDCARFAYPRLLMLSGDEIEGEWNGVDIVPESRKNLSEWHEVCSKAFVAIGNNQIRSRVQVKLDNAGFTIVSLFYPSAIVSPTASFGAGTLICPCAVVNADAKVGKGCIVNTGAIIEHECVIGDYSHVSPGAVLGGGVGLGAYAWICAGASIADHTSVGSHSVVGAGAAVVADIPEYVLAAGVPAIIKKRFEHSEI